MFPQLTKRTATPVSLGTACPFNVVSNAALTIGATVNFLGPALNVHATAATTGLLAPVGNAVFNGVVNTDIANAITAIYGQSKPLLNYLEYHSFLSLLPLSSLSFILFYTD